jgi:hypothetical protein
MRGELLIQLSKEIYIKNPYFIIYFNLWFSKNFKIVLLCINGITLLSVSKKIIQLSILVNMLSL